jgi:hypothetical protein
MNWVLKERLGLCVRLHSWADEDVCSSTQRFVRTDCCGQCVKLSLCLTN